MVAICQKCPSCGAAHNPLLNPSLRAEPASPRAEQEDNHFGCDMDGGDSFLYFCDACGESYALDSPDEF